MSQFRWSVSVGGAAGSSEAWFYLHDNNESQLGSQDMPELHSVGVLLHMAGRVAVITIPKRKEQQSHEFHFGSTLI